MPFKARAGMVAVMACMLVAGCDEKPAPPPDTAAAAPSRPAAKQAQLPPHMVAAVSAGESSSSVGVHFALASAPVVGRPLTVDIAIVAHQPFDSVHALFEAPDALAMVAGNHFVPRKDVKAESLLDHQLQLKPMQEGVFLITTAVETESREGMVTRIFSIPVIVTSASAAPAPAPAAPAAPARG